MGGHGKGAQRGMNRRGGAHTGSCRRRGNRVRTSVTRRGWGECGGESGGLRAAGRGELAFIKEQQTCAYGKVAAKVRRPE